MLDFFRKQTAVQQVASHVSDNYTPPFAIFQASASQPRGWLLYSCRMKCILNNEPAEFPGIAGDSMTVQRLLAAKNWTFPLIIVRIDGQLVERNDWDRVRIPEGSRVEAIHLVSGG